MHTEMITLDRGEADRLYRKYKTHLHGEKPPTPIDWEVQRTYDLLRKGRVIIKAIESIKAAGLNREFLPKLALTPATATECLLERYRDGQFTMAPMFPGKRWPHRGKHNLVFRENTFVFPAESFPMAWHGRERVGRSEHKALGAAGACASATAPRHRQLPRPLGGRVDAHTAARPIPSLRRIGKADLWLSGRALGPHRSRTRCIVDEGVMFRWLVKLFWQAVAWFETGRTRHSCSQDTEARTAAGAAATAARDATGGTAHAAAYTNRHPV